MFHRLQKAPVNSFEFQPCGRTSQAGKSHVSLFVAKATNTSHWSGHGLLGSLIPFASHAFVPKRLSCLVGRLLYWLAPTGHRIATLYAESFQPLHNTKRNGYLRAGG